MSQTNNKEIPDKISESATTRYLIIFLKHWKVITSITLAVGIIVTILAFFVIKPEYLSTAVIKASGKTSLGLGGLLSGAGIPDLGGLEELTGSVMVKELALYEEILQSRRCLEEVIKKYDLMKEYQYRFMQDAIKDFRENKTIITKNLKAGTIEVGAYDIYPERAKEIVEYMIELLNTINIEMNVQNAKMTREFIEERYNEVKRDLKAAEDSLKYFQEVYGFAPDVVTKTVVQSTVQLEADIESEKIKLELLKKALSPDESEVKLQEAKIAAMKKELENIKKSNDKSSTLRLKDAPDIVLNYMRLARNVEIQNKLLTYIIPLYEQAKIEEKKEMPSVIVLDYPSLPEYKKRPKRLTLIAVSVLATFVLLNISYILYEMYLKNLISTLKKARDK